MIPYLNKTYVTREGDMVDAICMTHYGRWSLDVLQAVWEANPWVLHGHLILPAGRILILPAAPSAKQMPVVLEMWKDEPVTKASSSASLLTRLPALEYRNHPTIEDYLEDYRRTKRQGADGIVVSLEQASQPLNGTLQNTNNEVYRYSPQAGFVGVDRFQLRATDGVRSDTDIIEIVVNPSGSVNRYEVFPNDQRIAKHSLLMFCAVKRTRIDAIQVFINRGEEELVHSHQVQGGLNRAYADVTVLKRLTSGGVVSFGDTKRLYNSKKTDAILPNSGGSIINPNECLIVQVVDVRGNVWGMSADIYSTLAE